MLRNMGHDRSYDRRFVLETSRIEKSSGSSPLIGPNFYIAGQSSPVARKAHNLEVGGSNPSPATKEQKIGCSNFYVCRVQEVKRVELFSINGKIDVTIIREDGGYCRLGQVVILNVTSIWQSIQQQILQGEPETENLQEEGLLHYLEW